MRGRVLGFGARAMTPEQKPKYLNTSENEVFHKGEIVYGADMARAAAAKAGRVVLVEGYTDVIALHQAGVPEVVAQMGTALTGPQVDAIARLAPKALFCQDPDRAGQESVAKGIAALRTHNRGRSTRAVEFRIVRLPAGEDPADVVQRSGAEAMRALLDEAMAIERFEVERALELPDATADEMLAAATGPIAALPAGRPARRARAPGLRPPRAWARASSTTPCALRPGRPRPNGHAREPPGRREPDRTWANKPAAPANRELAGVGESARRAGGPLALPPSRGRRAARAAPSRLTAAATGDPTAGWRQAPPPEWDGFSGDDPGPLDAPPPEWDGVHGRGDGARGRPPPPPPAEWAPPPARPDSSGASGSPEAEFRARNRSAGAAGNGDGSRQPLPDRPSPWTRARRSRSARRPSTRSSRTASRCPSWGRSGSRRSTSWTTSRAASTRQAAAHLRGRLKSPTRDLPTDNEPLARLVAQLVVWSGQLEATATSSSSPPSSSSCMRLERRISQARISGGEGMQELGARAPADRGRDPPPPDLTVRHTN